MSASSITRSLAPEPLAGAVRAWPWRCIGNTLNLLVILAATAFSIQDAWYGTGEGAGAFAFPLAICGANIIAIERVARVRTPGWGVVAYTAVVLLAGSLCAFSAVGIALTYAGLSDDHNGAELAQLLVTVSGLMVLGATLPALGVRESVRPAWWMHAILMPCLLGLGLIAVSDQVCDRATTWLCGPAKSAGLSFASWDFEMQASQLSEDALYWYFLLSAFYILVDALRVVILRADRELADQAAAGVESV